MAQFTAQRRINLLSGAGVRSSEIGSNDTLPWNRLSVELLGGKFRIRSSTKLYSSSAPQAQSTRQLHRGAGSASSVREDVVEWHGGSDDEYDDQYGDDDDLACFRGLVLDLVYRPVNVVCWRRAICLEFMEKADVLEYYDQTVDSPSGSFYIPAVLRVPHLLQVVKRRRIKSNLSRKNILHRDNYTCQYCSSRENLTIDHVVPVSRGGEWTWENLAPKEYDILSIPLTSSAIKMLKMEKETP